MQLCVYVILAYFSIGIFAFFLTHYLCGIYVGILLIPFFLVSQNINLIY